MASDAIPAAATPSGANPGRGVDITHGTHAAGNCSIVSYTGEKFYEYAALAKMIWLLATDAKARQQLMSGVSESALAHIVTGYGAAQVADSYYNLAATENVLSWFGWGNKARADKYAQDGVNASLLSQQEYSKAAAQIAEYFTEAWNAINKRFSECGWLYGVSTLALDAAFTVGELALGAGISAGAKAMLKAIKAIVRVIKVGGEAREVSKVAVTFYHAGGGKIERTFEREALEHEFGAPGEHHPGVRTEDVNREPEPQPKKKKKKLTSKQIGDAAERQAVEDLKAQGYTEVYRVQDASGHGVDAIGVNPTTGDVKALEVKANSASLSDAQNLGGENYVMSRLQAALSNPATEADASAALDAIRDADRVDYEIWKYDVDPEDGIVKNGRGAEWTSKKELVASGRKKRVFRKDTVAPTPQKSTNAAPPATGPPNSGGADPQ